MKTPDSIKRFVGTFFCVAFLMLCLNTMKIVSLASRSSAATNYIFGWARILTTVKDPNMNVNFDRAYYSDIIAFPTDADAGALKEQVSTYFNQVGVPDAVEVWKEQVQVRDVMVKTFPTLAEADKARYAMVTQDIAGLNAGSKVKADVPAVVSYFNWNYYGNRHELFSDITEFAATGANWNIWSYVVIETSAQKQINGKTVYEKRYYISYPFELFIGGWEGNKERRYLDTYFTKTVVEPAKQRGVTISYYNDNIREFNTSYETFAEAWAKRSEYATAIKHNGDTQYDFIIVNNGPNKGEATSLPSCAANCTGAPAPITSSK